MAREDSVLKTCKVRGIARRRSMEFCGTKAATLALPQSCAQTITEAVGQKRRPVHASASARAIENALGVEIPDKVRRVRNMIAGAQNVQDYVVYFCHFHALDWADVTSALKANPAKTSHLAQSISERPKSSPTYFKGVQDRVKALVASRQLSLFSSGDWGHPA